MNQTKCCMFWDFKNHFMFYKKFHNAQNNINPKIIYTFWQLHLHNSPYIFTPTLSVNLKPNFSSNYLWLDPHCHIFLVFQKLQAFLLWSLSYYFRKTLSNNLHHLILLFFKTWLLWWCSSFSSFVHTSSDQKNVSSLHFIQLNTLPPSSWIMITLRTSQT
jgi:hypothetical protein